MNQPRGRIRVSLQTKLLVRIVLILGVVLAGNSVVNYNHAVTSNERLAELRLLNIYNSVENHLTRATLQFERNITRLGNSAIDIEDARTRWPELFAGFSALRVLDHRGEVLARWPANNDKAPFDNSQHRNLLNQVLADGQPRSRMFCRRQCLQSSYVPLVENREHTIVINVLRPIEPLFDELSLGIEGDIALLNENLNNDNPARQAWVSHAEQTRPVIDELQRLTGFLDNSQPQYRKTGRGVFMAQTFSLPQQLAASSVKLAIVTSNARDASFMRDTLRSWLASAALTLLATIVLVYLALRSSLRKLVNLVRTIPMLSRSSYDDLRASIEPYTRKPGLVDEVDQLNYAVLDVAEALEEMETSVAEHRVALTHKLDELRETRDFNQVLMNDSPLVIVAHSPEGRIRLLNRYGRELSGWTENDIAERRISQLILPDLSGRSITELVATLVRGNEPRVQTEQLMAGAGNRVHDLTWMHAAVNTNSEPLILSVGLDITERRKTESRLRWLSKHDNVTDLLNRESFHEEANLLIQQYGETHRVDFMVVDIDKFAAINDMYGFQNGDVVLREAARYLERLIDCDTIIGRTGSNEYSALMVMERTEITDDQHPMLNRGLRFYSVLNEDAVEITLTGVLASYPHDGSSIDELVSNASAAMRRLGPMEKGCVLPISESVDSLALRQERLQVHDNVVRALSDERFILLYQPIYSVKTERISHCECLVRMRSEDGHLVSPAGFMDVAKEHGLMSRLDLQVLRMALIQLRAWANEGLDLKLSVNITAATFESDLFIKELKSLLAETGAPANRLIFEIVETEAINNLSTAKALCDRLAEMDIQIAFDDFGIGFTSFEYLRDLPVDYIKIDQSFIRYLYKRKSDQLLVKSMVDMALALGKKVVAEGVEDDGSADILRGMGVHYLQGYFISRPKHANELNLSFKMGIL